MTRVDIEKNAAEKRKYNDEVISKFYGNVHDKTVEILNRKNVFDKGSKMKLSRDSRDSHDFTSSEGYNI